MSIGMLKSLTEPFNHRPIILIGMHRSGTSLVAEMMTRAGVWMGSQKRVDYESGTFRRANKAILKQMGDDRYYGANSIKAMQDEAQLLKFCNSTRVYLKDHLVQGHFGRRWLVYAVRALPKKCFLWGWKDPTSTLFFEMWKRIFPKARFVAIVRHPEETCLSLYDRQLRRQKSRQKKRARGLISGQCHELDFAQCFEIWKTYNFEVVKALKRYPDDTFLLRYEKLNDYEVIANLLKFIGAKADPKHVAKEVKFGRNAYINPLDHLPDLKRQIQTDELVRELDYGVTPLDWTV